MNSNNAVLCACIGLELANLSPQLTLASLLLTNNINKDHHQLVLLLYLNSASLRSYFKIQSCHSTDQSVASSNILPDLQVSSGAAKTKNSQGHILSLFFLPNLEKKICYTVETWYQSQNRIPNHVLQTGLHYCTITCNKTHGVEYQKSLI